MIYSRQILRGLLGLCLFCLPSYTSLLSQNGVQALGQKPRPRILVETNKGKFVLELFNETPKHRDTFLRHVQSGAYEGTLFHRIIKGFMVQGGNLLSKGKKAQEVFPEDSISGEIDAEFRTEHFVHTQGMLAAARQSDELNPHKKSSGSQFYIVTGRYYTELDLQKETANHGIQYSPAQLKEYMLRGGAAHLDGSYTVFGRLLEGYKTIDKIQRVETDDEDRPYKAIRIIRMKLLP